MSVLDIDIHMHVLHADMDRFLILFKGCKHENTVELWTTNINLLCDFEYLYCHVSR